MLSRCRVELGGLGLTAADRRHEISEWYGVGAGLRLHTPYDDASSSNLIGLGINYMQQSICRSR